MPRFEVSRLVLNIEGDAPFGLEHMNDYLLIDHRDADFSINFYVKEYIDVPEGTVISDESISIKWLKKDFTQDGYYLYGREFGVGRILVILDVSLDWRNAKITWCDYVHNKNEVDSFTRFQTMSYVHAMMEIVFRYILLQFDGLIIHASTIKWKGKGLAFSAPSGTGKSTHVKLWQEHMADVIVLNDDTPAVRFLDNEPYVFGTPWCGSSFINRNDSAPLTAIILLEQAQENMIQRLNTQEAILRFMPRVLLPYFDQNLMSTAISIFEKIIASVPIYLLKCRPDKEAVELVYQCVK